MKPKEVDLFWMEDLCEFKLANELLSGLGCRNLVLRSARLKLRGDL